MTPPPCCADHSRKNGRLFMNVNHEWTRINTNRPEDRWTSFNDKRHQNTSATCPLGVTLSWEEVHPGARASRPHQAWHSPARILKSLRGPPVPTFGGSLLSLLQPLSGPSPFWVALGGYLFAFSPIVDIFFPLPDLRRPPLEPPANPFVALRRSWWPLVDIFLPFSFVLFVDPLRGFCFCSSWTALHWASGEPLFPNGARMLVQLP